MAISRLRLGFCLAVAVISAAIADPIVESASNAGWFGAGNFTDHSSIDVVPALIAGIVLLTLYLVRKAHLLVVERCASTLVAILPVVFVLQIIALYVIETSEQLVVWHHMLGPGVWLGGPAPVSVAVHAVIGGAVAFAMLRSNRRLARTTLRVIALIRAIVVARFVFERPLATRWIAKLSVAAARPVLCRIGERAPPALAL